MRLLDELTSVAGAAQPGCWHPAADVYRTSNGWLIKFDLAGVSPTELVLKREGRRLTVRGTRRDTLVQKGLSSYSLEINYNRFERAVELPSSIQDDQLTTEYRDGMLLVWLSRT